MHYQQTILNHYYSYLINANAYPHHPCKVLDDEDCVKDNSIQFCSAITIDLFKQLCSFFDSKISIDESSLYGVCQNKRLMFMNSYSEFDDSILNDAANFDNWAVERIVIVCAFTNVYALNPKYLDSIIKLLSHNQNRNECLDDEDIQIFIDQCYEDGAKISLDSEIGQMITQSMMLLSNSDKRFKNLATLNRIVMSRLALLKNTKRDILTYN